MISFSNEPALDECGRGEPSKEPRAVGQFMAAVLARYGVSANVDPIRPRSEASADSSRLPRVEHRPTQLGGILPVVSVG
jgi:hypothetical protein